jgi:hypothetical protein
MELFYYVDAKGQQQGPIEANKLPGAGVTAETLVWKSGMPSWQKASAVAELAKIIPPAFAPPPLPATATPTPATQPTNQAPYKPDSLMVWSILTTLFCCLPLGVVAIVQSSRVDSLWATKEYEAAKKAANSAKTWNIASAITGGVFILAYFIFMVADTASIGIMSGW